MKIQDINPNLLKTQYAVRGPIVSRAQELEREGKKIIYCNIGNPQALKQKPITFVRQLLSLVEYPELLKFSKTSEIFPSDVIERAEKIIRENPNGMGAYTQSEGMFFVREAVKNFIERRDKTTSDVKRIILTDGASKGIQFIFTLLTRNKKTGFMIPIPQYPLYSATIRLYGASQINYYLDEENDWQLNEKELKSSISSSLRKGIHPVAIVVINPGNPTGAVLAKKNIKMIINFARENKLTILADEVYQENIYDRKNPFHSFAKIMTEMKINDVPLFSFHSVSKGFFGECGHRGGYMEARNVSNEIYEQIVKLQSVGLCANTAGQIVTYAMVAPPKKGEKSYPLYKKERNFILSQLKEKAEILSRELNKIEGMEVKIPRGAMYAFVKINLPESGKSGAEANFDYCLGLLEETGICVVPGSGFGQKRGTFHFRTTFLPPKNEIKAMAEKMRKFHSAYLKKLISREP